VAGRLGADFPEYSIKNQSVNGRTIEGLLADTTDFSGQYELILLQIGGNDILQKRSTKDTVNDLNALLERLAKHTEHIVMMTSGNVGGAVAFSGEKAATYESLSRALRTEVTNIAQTRTDFSYVDLFDEPEDDPFVENPETYTAADSLHPSNEGYALWYNKLKPVVEPILNNLD
jgi:lysophospholipase L1-like esterase